MIFYRDKNTSNNASIKFVRDYRTSVANDAFIHNY